MLIVSLMLIESSVQSRKVYKSAEVVKFGAFAKTTV